MSIETREDFWATIAVIVIAGLIALGVAWISNRNRAVPVRPATPHTIEPAPEPTAR